jgi:transposase
MLSQSQRTTILELHRQGVPRREIARLLEISRVTVRGVLQSNSADVPELNRPEKAEPYRQQILELMHMVARTCHGPLGIRGVHSIACILESR